MDLQPVHGLSVRTLKPTIFQTVFKRQRRGFEAALYRVRDVLQAKTQEVGVMILSLDQFVYHLQTVPCADKFLQTVVECDDSVTPFERVTDDL